MQKRAWAKKAERSRVKSVHTLHKIFIYLILFTFTDSCFRSLRLSVLSSFPLFSVHSVVLCATNFLLKWKRFTFKISFENDTKHLLNRPHLFFASFTIVCCMVFHTEMKRNYYLTSNFSTQKKTKESMNCQRKKSEHTKTLWKKSQWTISGDTDICLFVFYAHVYVDCVSSTSFVYRFHRHYTCI